ncbi:hypothetical protein [Streptomyces sp. NPDC056361]|uniref:hypothetical protein n=1 Tax=Streptomyces sp. NPDC056361 TaxID=3345795 RepID=UPI0035DEDBF3
MEDFVAELAEVRPELVRLAECLCLAAGVERAFLRRARLRFVPDSTAGLEAELWFSPLVEAAGEHMLLLDGAAAEVLRRRLARRDPASAVGIREFTEEAHRESPPVVRWFEELTWEGLFPSETTDRIVRAGLGRMLAAVAADGDDAADDLGRWALRYLPRLPAAVLGLDDAWRIQVASSERLGIEPPTDRFERPSSVTESARALVRREVSVGVRARPGGVVVSYPAAAGSLPVRAIGGRTVRLDVRSTLVPVPQAALSRLEVRRGQSVSLPVTVVQRLHGSGEPLMSIAHPGTASEVAVAANVMPDDVDGARRARAHYAVLMKDGTIVLHAGDGSVIDEVPPPPDGTARHGVALSADGTLLAWIEGNEVHQYALEPYGVGSGSVATGDETMVSLSFHGDSERLAWLFVADGELVLRRSLLPDIRCGRPREGISATWQYPSGDAVAVVDGEGDLWLRKADGLSSPQHLLGTGFTTVTGHGDGAWIIGGQPNGDVTAWSGDGSLEFLVGTAPWAVTDLAVSTDGRTVAAVGGDSLVLFWYLGDDERRMSPRQIRLAFSADRVFPHRNGGWIVSGEGGPVELRTEDGRRHLVTPEFPAEPPAPGVPPWIRGCVIAETGDLGAGGERASELVDSMRDIAAAGVRCLAVGPLVPPHFLGGVWTTVPRRVTADDLETVAELVEAADRHGICVVVDLLLPEGEFGRMSPVAKARIYDGVRRLLDRGAGGVRLHAAEGTGRQLLNDLHHLLDGYEDRVLIRRSSPSPALIADEDLEPASPSDPGALFHVATSSLGGALARGVRDAELGSEAWAAFGSALVEAGSAPTSARPGFQWEHVLPGGLDPAQRRLAAAVLLGLPGCPALPLDLLREPGTAALLGLRRAHLALSRGTLHVYHAGPGTLATLREHGTETILCLANSATRPTVVTFGPERIGRRESSSLLLDLVDGSVFDSRSGDPASVVIPGQGVRWLLVLTGSPSVGTEG